MNKQNWKEKTSLFLIQDETEFTYSDLYTAVSKYEKELRREFEGAINSVVFQMGSNQFESYAKFIAALSLGKTVFLYSKEQGRNQAYLDQVLTEIQKESLKENGARFIVRTSGSSGPQFKLILHDPNRFFDKYKKIGPHFKRTFAFSPAESIAGIETLLEVLTHELTLITSQDDLSPEVIGHLINRHKVDYFQTTPTFMNLMVVAKTLDPAQLSSLQKIAFGSEPSQSSVLAQFKKVLPSIKLVHTYGMSEIGIQKTETNSEDPTRIRLDSDYNPADIINGLLHVKSLSKMLRYLNSDESPSPLGSEWFNTHDQVLLEDTWIKVLGRDSDLINIGGRKFFPAELEDKLRHIDHVQDVTVIAEKNEMVGTILTALITLASTVDETEFRKSYKAFCEKNILSYMHPHKLKIRRDLVLGERLKKMRKL